jgi:hypothetical protein
MCEEITMKATITKSDGTIIELDGTPDEIREVTGEAAPGQGKAPDVWTDAPPQYEGLDLLD